MPTKGTCNQVFITVTFIIEKTGNNQIVYPLVNGQKMQYAHVMDYYLAIKMIKILIHAII